MIADKILDVSLELLERLEVFQDRKADRLQARSDRRHAKATKLVERATGKRADLRLRRADNLFDEARRLQIRAERILEE